MRLNRGGRILIYVPHANSASTILFRGRSSAYWIPFHMQLFSARGLTRLLERTGFCDVKVTTYTPLSWWSLTARQLLAKPGYLHRPPTPLERFGMQLSSAMVPLWLSLAWLGRGEELVGHARIA